MLSSGRGPVTTNFEGHAITSYLSNYLLDLSPRNLDQGPVTDYWREDLYNRAFTAL